MKELSPKARQLIDAGRTATDPTQEERERTLAALRARLGLPLGDGTGSDGIHHPARSPGDPESLPSSPPSTMGPRGLMIPGVVIGGAAILAGILYLSHPLGNEREAASDQAERLPPTDPSAQRDRPKTAQDGAATFQGPDLQRVEADDPAPQNEQELGVQSEPTATTRPLQRSKQAIERKGPDTGGLAEEVTLLSRATSALASGRPQEALVALEEHRRKFPQGVLSQERRSAQAQALCQAGQLDRARAILDALPASSPLAARAALACGFH